MNEGYLQGTNLADEFERIRFLIDPHGRVEEDRPCEGGTSMDGGMLDHLTAVLSLSGFERDVLLLCLYLELNSGVGDLLEASFGNRHPSFGVALQLFPHSHWSAASPDAPLRRWKLIEMNSGETVAGAPIRLNEFVFHALLGVRSADPRLAGHVSSLRTRPLWAGSQCEMAARLGRVWSGMVDSRLPIVQLVGTAPGEARGIAAEAARDLRFHLWQLPSGAIPTRFDEIDQLAVLLNRDAVVFGSALLIEADMPDPDESRRIGWLVDRAMLPTAIACREPIPLQATSIRLEIGRPTVEEQVGALAARMPQPLNGHAAELDRASSVFLLSSQELESVAAAITGGQGIWNACRTQSRSSMDGLAQRIEPKAHWDDLVLPDQTMRVLGEIAAQVTHRRKVYTDWGFAEREFRGQGLSALFSGPSGTGKTLAAEVLANQLEIDLYRIDLSAVVSKYIGETEKNLRRVFDAAEGSGAVLLFDEADALFGKRSDVKDSHDRYANIEVSYLLQRMEAYRGVAILTSNAKTALDPAFLRRLRFIVNFPFPDASMRELMWRRAFPDSAPTDGLDFAKLARLNVTGGNIHNIALGAAFLAAEEATAIDMTRILAAARSEVAKYDRLLNESEIAGWIGEHRR